MMKLTNEREITITFIILGIFSGIAANSLKNLLFAFSSSLLIFIVGFFLVYKIFKQNKIQPLLFTSGVTYTFLLLIVWIVLNSLNFG